MNREQMIEKAAALIAARRPFDDTARAVVDVLLPQVTTVEALEALPVGTVLVSSTQGMPVGVVTLPIMEGVRGYKYGDGSVTRSPRQVLVNGPLTVVWSPS